MTRSEKALPVGTRCDAIAARLADCAGHRRRRAVLAVRGKKWTLSDELRERMNQRRARERAERIRIEAPAWAQAVQDYGGVLAKIAMRMGYCASTARIVLHELGLWDAVVAAREARLNADHQRPSTGAE